MALLIPCAVLAQGGGAGMSLQTITFGDALAIGVEEAQLLTIPVELSWTHPRAWIRVEGGYADGIVTFPGGGSSALSGPLDTRLVVGTSVSFATFRALAVLPTGDSRYAASELPLLGVLSSELLAFSIDSWGGGGAYGGEAEIVVREGSWAIGLTGGYVVPLEHEPFQSADLTYTPGSEGRLRMSVARRVGQASSIALTAGYRHPSRASYADTELYQPGDRWDAQVEIAHPFGARESASIHAGLYSRGNGGILLPLAVAGPILPGIAGSAARKLLSVGAGFHFSRADFVFVPEGEIRLFRVVGGVGDGSLSSVGLSVDRRILGRRWGRRLVASTSARFHVGSMDTAAGGTSSLRGWEIGLSVRLERGG